MGKAEIKRFQIDLTNKCNAKCIFCPRTNFYKEKMSKLVDLDTDLFKKVFDKKYIKNIDRILYNGNLGEPTLSKNIFAITEYIESNNPDLFIWTSTNGSTHNPEWWYEFGKRITFNEKNQVRFGIDGLEDTHKNYRGTDYKTVLKNMESFIKAGGKAQWQFLIFHYNEHQVEEARQISKDLGCQGFVLLTSRNYNEYGFQKPSTQKVKTKTEVCAGNTDEDFCCTTVDLKGVYISHDGKVYPCCDYGLFDRFYEVEKYPLKMYIEYLRSKEKLDLHNYTLDEAINTPFFRYVIENRKKLIRCQLTCRFNRLNPSTEMIQIYNNQANKGK